MKQLIHGFYLLIIIESSEIDGGYCHVSDQCLLKVIYHTNYSEIQCCLNLGRTI